MTGACLVIFFCVVAIAGLVYRQCYKIQRFFESARSGQIVESNIRGPVAGYYVDFSARYRTKHPLDPRGLPLFVRDDQSYYHPVLISEVALGAYEQYLKTGDATAKQKFLLCADWLKDNLKRRGDFDYWEYTLPLPTARFRLVS